MWPSPEPDAGDGRWRGAHARVIRTRAGRQLGRANRASRLAIGERLAQREQGKGGLRHPTALPRHVHVKGNGPRGAGSPAHDGRSRSRHVAFSAPRPRAPRHAACPGPGRNGGKVRRGPPGTPDGQACSRQQAAGGLRGNGPASNVIYFNIKARVQIDNETANRIIVRPEGPSRGQD